MLHTLVSLAGWLAAILMIAVVGLLAFNRQSGLTLLQHRAEMLPQAMLVRYLGLALLALIAGWLGASVVLLTVLLCFAVIGLGDAYIYRRAGHPFLLHLAAGAAALLGAAATGLALLTGASPDCPCPSSL